MPIGESTGIAPRTNTEHGLIRQKTASLQSASEALKSRVREEAYVETRFAGWEGTGFIEPIEVVSGVAP